MKHRLPDRNVSANISYVQKCKIETLAQRAGTTQTGLIRLWLAKAWQDEG